MILRLMRYNLASPLAVLLSLGCAALVIAAPSIGLLLALPFFFLIWQAMPRRGSRFEAALPIDGRQIVLARMFSTLVVVLLPIVAWMIAQLTRPHLHTPIPGVLEYAAIATLAVMLPFLQRPGELTAPPQWRVAAAWLLLAAFSVFVVLVLSPVVGLVVLSLGIVVVGFALLAATPSALQVAPIAIATDRSDEALRSAGVSNASANVGARRLVVRSMFSPQTLYFAPLLIFAGWAGESTIYLLIGTLSVSSIVRYRTRWLTALPLSHRVRLGVLLVPSLVVSLGCLSLAKAIHAAPFGPKEQFERAGPSPSHDPRYKKNRTQVPLEFWDRVQNGRDPIIAAPWGEAIDADTITILGVTLANPFSTDEKSSKRFVEWQFERATSAVFGRSITLTSYDSSSALPPSMLSTPRMQLLNAAAIVSSLLLLLAVTELAHWNLFTRQIRIPRLGDAVSLVPLAAMMGIYFYYENRRHVNVVVSVAEMALRSLSNWLPANPLVLSLAAVLPVALSYAILEWLFDRAELTVRIKPRSA